MHSTSVAPAMKGKRFVTPTAGHSMRLSSTAQPHSFSRPSAGRWRSPAGASERPAPHVRSNPRPSSGPRVATTTTTPERRPRGVPSNNTRISAPNTSVQHMLNELVVLSRSIADLLEHEELSPTPALTSSARQQEAGLKTQEIERIVRRVEAHFVDKVQALEATNATLRVEVRQLRQALQAQSRSDGVRAAGVAAASGAASHDVRGGLKEEIEALDALDRAWARDGNGAAALSEAEQLRRVLLAEKRQRLRVEEQTQSLTEQHAKVVGTLERRLKKQEEQLYDLIAAIDRGYSGVPATPTRSIERGSSHRLSTPRHLLRQQLAQHQQTQRALQEYKENLRYESPSSALSDDVAAMEELGLDDVRCTLESIRSSKPLTVKEQTQEKPNTTAAAVTATSASAAQPVATPPTPHHSELEVVCTSFSATTAAASAAVSTQPPLTLAASSPPLSQLAAMPVSSREVDEITSFLDSITKELESLDAA